MRMGEIPDELKEDERTGALRLVVHSSMRKQPDGGHVLDMQETASLFPFVYSGLASL